LVLVELVRLVQMMVNLVARLDLILFMQLAAGAAAE
jgi:hypothetical protein